MIKRCKGMFALFLVFTSLISCASVTCASADADMRRAVIGADLNEDQINTVYQSLGIQRGDVPELRLTNADEHAVLDGYVDTAVIGTKSMSCVYLELLPQGSGISITVQNVSWCTPEMYRNAFLTAGITDARIMVAAPFPVSGTAALAGIYKAYEDMTGVKLDAAVKDASTQELTVTGELARIIGSSESTSIVNELKNRLNETANMTDEELSALIRQVAAQYGVNLSDSQVQQLLDLCRSMEHLDRETLTQKVEDLQGTFEKMADAKDQVAGFLDQMKELFAAVREFFDKVSSIFGGREETTVVQ